MTQYVVGLLFSVSGEQVLLIEKKRPAWQDGLRNGVGGKVEPGETPLQAMEREAEEEAGIKDVKWQPVVILRGAGHRANNPNADFIVHFFRAFSDDAFGALEQKTDERLIPMETVIAVSHIKTMPNLHWIIALAVDPCIQLPIHVSDEQSRLSQEFMPWADYGD